jgi:cytochrome oxidase Cu insertion factor (SCO1/SenC/PrrC family)
MKRFLTPVPLLAILFVGPLVLAVVLYFWQGAIGGFGQIPNPDRELIEGSPQLPPIELTGPDGGITAIDGLRSRWSLIYARMPACEETCRQARERLHQVYLALGTDRVQLVFLAPASEFRSPQPADWLIDDWLTGVLDAANEADLTGIFGTDRLDDGRYFVVDPLGNFILSYPADADQGRLLEDMERLLDVSRIG